VVLAGRDDDEGRRLRSLDPLMATLRAEGLTKSYGGRTVVRAIDLQVSSGEIVGLLGPNGAGKTTTFGMVVGLTAPDAGRVLLDDADLTDDPMYVRARKGLGYLPQEPSVFRGLTVEQNVLAILETLPLGAAERRERLSELLSELGLTKLAGARAYALSGGERRRVEITRALVNRPKFMLLDEPFAGIDPIAVADIQKIVGRAGSACSSRTTMSGRRCASPIARTSCTTGRSSGAARPPGWRPTRT
jgi:lipopolysaccharide export system ATP-binding protein